MVTVSKSLKWLMRLDLLGAINPSTFALKQFMSSCDMSYSTESVLFPLHVFNVRRYAGAGV
jgi:hypothetical protein